MGMFDLEEQFTFYGAYHNNPINIALHMVFVWPILFTALLLLNFTPPLFSQSPIHLFGQSFLVLNYGFLCTVIYALYYVSLDKKAGSLAAFMCFLCWAGSSALAHLLGFSLGWKVVLVSQLVCWTGQFIGHGVFEKRAPALLDNLAQAFLMAPFFVLLEALQYAFDYEPCPGFNARVQAKVDAEIRAWKESKNKLIS
ncbi:2-hydroxy-palmitic acid dioxygenase mpo1-like [Salvia splendens]|uniref:2-hydroxy-palmitic acid dioxygenase mpo1-like n=1 Tax=Salvia splendens TaxID=180675 RepID=UPI001C267AE5|nr:2-hydroxy-palmitic acid dioxygenase mpo1-like [Salvia splendens]